MLIHWPILRLRWRWYPLRFVLEEEVQEIDSDNLRIYGVW